MTSTYLEVFFFFFFGEWHGTNSLYCLSSPFGILMDIQILAKATFFHLTIAFLSGDSGLMLSQLSTCPSEQYIKHPQGCHEVQETGLHEHLGGKCTGTQGTPFYTHLDR
jgi:hypothetical protein